MPPTRSQRRWDNPKLFKRIKFDLAGVAQLRVTTPVTYNCSMSAASHEKTLSSNKTQLIGKILMRFIVRGSVEAKTCYETHNLKTQL
jgi:hypothetical protein